MLLTISICWWQSLCTRKVVLKLVLISKDIPTKTISIWFSDVLLTNSVSNTRQQHRNGQLKNISPIFSVDSAKWSDNHWCDFHLKTLYNLWKLFPDNILHRNAVILPLGFSLVCFCRYNSLNKLVTTISVLLGRWQCSFYCWWCWQWECGVVEWP